MNTNLPQTVQKGIFFKIKTWFMKIIKNKNLGSEQETEIINEDNKLQVNDEFLSTIRMQTNILAETLQYKLRSGEVRASELSDEEYEEVINLYDTQIREMTNKLEEYKEKIRKIKKV